MTADQRGTLKERLQQVFVCCVCVYMRVRIYGPSKRFCDHCQQVSLLLLLLCACMCACSMHDERNIASDRTLARKNVCTHKCMHAFKLKNVKRERRQKRETDRQTGRQAGKQTDRQTDRQAGWQTEGRTDRQTGIQTFLSACLSG